MSKLLGKILRHKEKFFLKEILEMLEELKKDSETMTKEEKEQSKLKIISMLEEKSSELEKQIELKKLGVGGKCWDFQKEKALEKFIEDDEIYLRNCQEMERNMYMQIKRENEEEHLSKITDRMIKLAEQVDVEPRKLLSHVLEYRFWVEDGKIVYAGGEG